MNSKIAAGLTVAVAGFWAFGAAAQTVPNPDRPFVGGYTATIWVDPDGCQHWVMDTGNEGFMSQRLDAHGRPVCGRVITCGTIDADLLFPVDGYRLRPSVVQELRSFFTVEAAKGTTFLIRGHTDSTYTEEYNLGLSQRRADSVASVATSVDATVTTEALGEGSPIATNATVEGRRQNRRVEIVCQ
jgi:outer membrane protein OmpA-like peptidoglycan-associated protein